jgi:hypothetical protein
MKPLLLSLFLILGFVSYSQTLKFQAELFSIRELDEETNVFYDWKQWKYSDAIIIFDVSENVLKIHSSFNHTYLIVKPLEKVEMGETIVYSFSILDHYNVPCLLEIMQFSNDKFHFYLRWSNFQVAYQTKKL